MLTTTDTRANIYKYTFTCTVTIKGSKYYANWVEYKKILLLLARLEE